MGAKASKDKVEGSLVVMIVLGGGKRETYSRPGTSTTWCRFAL